MFKKLSKLFLAALIAVTAVLGTVSLSYGSVNAVDSMVFIYGNYKDIDGEIKTAYGSAFFVGNEGEDPQYLVTNFHVVKYFITYEGATYMYVSYDKNDYEECYIVGYNANTDLAVLKIADPTSKRSPLGIEVPTDDMLGQSVRAVGFPAAADVLKLVSAYTKDDVTITSGIISRYSLESKTGRRLIQTDAEINSGNSGGPLINEAGNAIGVNALDVVDSTGSKVSGVNFAVSTEELIPLLNMYDIPYYTSGSSAEAEVETEEQKTANEASEETDKETDENEAGAADESADEISQEAAEETEPAPEPTSRMPVIAVVVLIVVIIAAIAVILTVKKGGNKNNTPLPSPTPTPAPAPASAPVSAAKKPVVRSLAQQHSGAAVNVSSTITIGRDQNCQLKFSPDTVGISRQHCQIRWDGSTNEFIINDLNSSYGTYLANGSRIPANIPYRLNPGSVIYLGDPANALRLETE